MQRQIGQAEQVTEQIERELFEEFSSSPALEAGEMVPFGGWNEPGDERDSMHNYALVGDRTFAQHIEHQLASSSASSSSHLSLHQSARTDQTARAAQTKRINTNDNSNTAKEHSCVQQQVAVSKKRRCAKPLAHINLPHPDAPKVSNRIGDAISAKPRSEEGETRCAMK